MVSEKTVGSWEETSPQRPTFQGTALKFMLALVKRNLYLSVMDKLEPPKNFLFEGNVP